LLTVLGGSGAGEEVQNQGNERNQQNEMDQRSGYVKNKEAANPSNEEQQSNHQKWSKSHMPPFLDAHSAQLAR
jgi:hypothetical protein